MARPDAPRLRQYQRLEKELTEWNDSLAMVIQGGTEIRRRLAHALRTRRLEDYEAVEKALSHWLDTGTLLLEPTPQAKPPSTEKPSASIRVYKARGHASHASKEGKIRALIRDGMAL